MVGILDDANYTPQHAMASRIISPSSHSLSSKGEIISKRYNISKNPRKKFHPSPSLLTTRMGGGGGGGIGSEGS